MRDLARLKLCDAGPCLRLTPAAYRYCCAACRSATEATPRRDVRAHSKGCDQRTG